ncbi:MAG: UpxY family transcription antiterminator [Bacteroides sp.]|nr:UpxY family transcription antiterminator [Bacteroides sp.]
MSNQLKTTVLSGVDDAVGVPDAKWFVAIVNSRHEKSVAESLQNLNVECYVATQKEMRVWKNGKRKIIDRVVIPSMVFVKCTEKDRKEIVGLPFINRFMVNRAAETGGMNKPVAVIGDSEIAKLKFMLGQTERPVEFVPSAYKVKDRVRVVRGSFQGLTGEILTNSDRTHDLLVGIAMLGGARMLIDPIDVVKIDNQE